MYVYICIHIYIYREREIGLFIVIAINIIIITTYSILYLSYLFSLCVHTLEEAAAAGRGRFSYEDGS